MTRVDHWKNRMVLTCILLVFTLTSCSKGNNDPLIESSKWVTEKVIAPNTEQIIFFSPVAGSKVCFHIFLPDEYQADPSRQFPVIYWLHGSGGGTGGILPLVNHFKNAMEQEKIPPAIVVFPNGLPHGMWCNSKDGNQPVESMFIEDLITFVDENYRTVRKRNGRIVEGFSMGGYGAGRLGFKYYDLFGGFSMLGAGPLQLDFSVVAPDNRRIQPRIFKDVYGEDMDYFEDQSPWRLAEKYGYRLPDPTPKRVIVGKAEYVYQANLDFSDHLKSLEIPHQFRAFENVGHNVFAYFSRLGELNWIFYNAVFSADHPRKDGQP